MRLRSKSNQLALIFLTITLILLSLSRLTTPWDLHSQPITVSLNQDPSSHSNILPPASQTPSANIALLLETRPLPHILPLLLHTSSVLGPSWPIHIITSSSVTHTLLLSAAFRRGLANGVFVLRKFPDGLSDDFAFHDRRMRGEFLMQPWLWEMLEPVERVLVLGSEGVVCSASEGGVEDFLGYDFIGAVVEKEEGEGKDGQGEKGWGVSGTFSLRNRKAMVDITRNEAWRLEREGQREEDGRRKVIDEAAWFWEKLRKYPVVGEDAMGRKAKLPSREVAERFAVRRVWGEMPWAFDGARRWWADDEERWKEVVEWCPEVGIVMGDKTVGEGAGRGDEEP